jgi:hypothetical protein
MSPDTRFIDNWLLTLGWKILPLTINRVMTGREPGVRGVLEARDYYSSWTGA